MRETQSREIISVLYDGVASSVFQSLVLAPFIERLKSEKGLTITIVSFEANSAKAYDVLRQLCLPNSLKIVIKTRLPFMGKPSLVLSAYSLTRILQKKQVTEIIARGPLAGWVAMKARAWLGKQIPLTMQARGLCAEEYRYSCMRGKQALLQSLRHRFMYALLYHVESVVYCVQADKNIVIEAVSPALKSYLINTFGAEPANIILAQHDLPKSINRSDVIEWRTAKRNQLSISKDAYVYCYSGSYKPWQCAQETVEFFVKELKKNRNAFLLILTPDIEPFLKALARYPDVKQNNYVVLSVAPHKLPEYIAAADAGLLFRHTDVINWVSRPTKMLEYQALGLPIIHNKTIAWLSNT